MIIGVRQSAHSVDTMEALEQCKPMDFVLQVLPLMALLACGTYLLVSQLLNSTMEGI